MNNEGCNSFGVAVETKGLVCYAYAQAIKPFFVARKRKKHNINITAVLNGGPAQGARGAEPSRYEIKKHFVAAVGGDTLLELLRLTYVTCALRRCQ